MRCDVRVAGLGEIAVRCAADEPSITRRIEPPLRLAVRHDWSWRLVRLVVALPPSTTIAAIATAVAVELLMLGAAAVLTAVIAMVAMLPVIPVLWSLRRLGRCCRALLACVPHLGRSVGGRGRWRWRRGVLGDHGCDGWRRGVSVIPGVGWRVWARFAVRVRLALFGGIATIRARPSAATVRASAFGHATMFVMGVFTRDNTAGLPARRRGAPVESRDRTKRHASP